MKTKKGFTLIELLVVISIIALLVSILMPALGRAKQMAKSVVCLFNTKQMGLGFNLYSDDNNDSLGEGVVWEKQSLGYVDQGHFWPNEIGPYCQGQKDIWLCPAADKTSNSEAVEYARENGTIPNSMGGGPSWKTFEAWIWPWGWYGNGPEWDWAKWILPGDLCSYGRNDWAANPPRQLDVINNGWADTKNCWRKRTARGDMNNIPILMDAIWNEIHAKEFIGPPEHEDVFVNWSTDFFCIDRHLGGVNAVFMDFTARKVRLKELWELKWHRNWSLSNPWTRAGGVQPGDWPEWMRGL